jgi:hypothetical protein
VRVAHVVCTALVGMLSSAALHALLLPAPAQPDVAMLYINMHSVNIGISF